MFLHFHSGSNILGKERTLEIFVECNDRTKGCRWIKMHQWISPIRQNIFRESAIAVSDKLKSFKCDLSK